MRFSLGLVLAVRLFAQEQTPPAGPVETTTKDEPATFKARVNLVMVPVVVRDKQGRGIGTLKKEDFQLLDKGKPQIIDRFSVEKPSTVMAGEARKKAAEGIAKDAPELPERYVAYLFDDLHLRFADMARVRDAAWEHMRDSLRANDRAAIYSTSGQTQTEFTDDKDKLRGTLFTLQPRSISNRAVQECPDVNYYMADLIQNKNDTIALNVAILDAIACGGMDPKDPSTRQSAESMVRAATSRALAVGGQETRVALGVLRDVVRRMASVPGQRMIVLASPGFLATEERPAEMEIMDRAIRANVTINSLDARGLWVEPSLDVSRGRASSQYIHDSAVAESDVLAELASGTGGLFFQNNNDLAAGFRKLSELPEYVYILGFSPQNLKLDGSYHSLKVILRTPAGLTASARRGYYAPRHLSDPVETAKEEIREALFSREEMREIPVELQSQFFKPSNETARVTVLARIDLKTLKFRKSEERNRNDLTVVFGLFDRNGNFVAGAQKAVEMRLKDETLTRPSLGIVVRNTFDVKPGAYLMRVVVRDAEGNLMTALNGGADIP